MQQKEIEAPNFLVLGAISTAFLAFDKEIFLFIRNIFSHSVATGTLAKNDRRSCKPATLCSVLKGERFRLRAMLKLFRLHVLDVACPTNQKYTMPRSMHRSLLRTRLNAARSHDHQQFLGGCALTQEN